jgi:lysophospholipase L1-like esterase
LGDSFTFGWGVNEQEGWPGLLESQLGLQIYNLGIHDASPRQELEVLKHVLQENGDQVRIRKLLWMIYEGNDLEDDYTEEVRRDDGPVKTPLTKGTLIAAMNNLVRTIQSQSVINRLRRGQVNWNKWSQGSSASPNSVDGVELVHPLYYSEQLGPRLFYQYYVDLAGKSASYVNTHWNHEAVGAVIREMRVLADQHKFDVVVIAAPSAARLHGPYFENFPKISTRPHFLDFFLELSEKAGFETVNLYELMRPYAGVELLYFRDDDHFNHRGNELAAELIQQVYFNKELPQSVN